MSEESFNNFLYVTLPQVGGPTNMANNHHHHHHHLDVINILTPILNVEENGVVTSANSSKNSNSSSNGLLTTRNDSIHAHYDNIIINASANTVTTANKHEQDAIDTDVVTATAEIVEIKTEDGCSSLVDDGSGELNLKRHERLQKDIIRKKMARLRETEQQRRDRLQKDRERKKQARQNETFEQRQRRLEKDRIRIQRRRALETDEERRRRLEKNRISKRNARIKENSRFRI